ncbi:cytochrome P450 [Gordonia sp. ABSL1-1]|uniref:cytochrome P450 n=1 Tax=Gordonia sp. ABSL1-1 TaxID=3053923 RepID=UPI0025747A89|nr:cytochrome P450 [Gordonia sp. ABSL1-1]MDL9936114.1 cytochrome P450 [Gordonia sp. ABSL1-1]
MALPHPPHRLPLLGDVIGMNPQAPMQSLVDMAGRLGPIFETTTMGARYVVAAGVDVVTELNDERRFAKYLGPELVALRPAAGNGLFTADGDDPQWRAAHELLMPAFTKQSMQGYHDTMLDVAAELTDWWDGRLGQPVDVPADMTRTALETIGRASAGYGFGGFGDAEAPPFVGHMVGALQSALVGSFLRESWLPNRWARRSERRVRRHGEELGAIVDDITATRRAMIAACADDSSAPTPPADLLTMMLTPGPDGTPVLDDANIRYQLITFLIAGHETTSGAMSFALHELSTRPDLIASARAEIDQVWGDDPRPDFEQVTKLRYVRRLLDETLRLHPTVPGYFRVAREDTVLDNGHRVEAGDWFLVLVGGLHRDPRWGPGVDAFDPDRFLPERVRSRPANLYKPFGTGLRACIGRQFAIHEAVLVLATLIRRYDLAPTVGYRLRTAERLTTMPRGLHLTPTRATQGVLATR